MGTAIYKFSRATNVVGFFSRNRASTDALNALNIWKGQHPQRTYEVIDDNDDDLEARIAWFDDKAGPELDGACNVAGVARSFVAA